MKKYDIVPDCLPQMFAIVEHGKPQTYIAPMMTLDDSLLFVRCLHAVRNIVNQAWPDK